jgi:hypothetical protein
MRVKVIDHIHLKYVLCTSQKRLSLESGMGFVTTWSCDFLWPSLAQQGNFVVDEVLVKASMLSSMSSSEVGEFSKVYHLHKHTGHVEWQQNYGVQNGPILPWTKGGLLWLAIKTWNVV